MPTTSLKHAGVDSDGGDPDVEMMSLDESRSLPFLKVNRDSLLSLFQTLPKEYWYIQERQVETPQLMLRPFAIDEIKTFEKHASQVEHFAFDGPRTDRFGVDDDSLCNFVLWYSNFGWRPIFPALTGLSCTTDDDFLMDRILQIPGRCLNTLVLNGKDSVMPSKAVVSLLARSKNLRGLSLHGQTVKPGPHRETKYAPPSDVIAFLPRLPSLSFVCLAGHSVGTAEWVVLSRLPLRVLDLAFFVPKSALRLHGHNSGGFAYLASLRLDLHALDANSCIALKSIRSPGLVELNLIFTRCPDHTQVHAHLLALASAPFAQSLRYLEFKLSHVHRPAICSVSRTPIRPEHLVGLLSFPSLKYLKFECNHLHVTGVFLLDLARALQNVETLLLKQRYPSSDGAYPKITDALPLFAHCCPRLLALSLDLDVDVGDMLIPGAMHFRQLTLEALGIGYTVANPQDGGTQQGVPISKEVLAYASAIFPNIKTVAREIFPPATQTQPQMS